MLLNLWCKVLPFHSLSQYLANIYSLNIKIIIAFIS